jgi:hypothetical protein
MTNNKYLYQPTVFEGVDFISEQDGLPERELKHKLSEMFKMIEGISRAYLCQIVYRNTNEHAVALCAVGSPENQERFVEQITSIFSGLFHVSQFLDIIVLNEQGEEKITQVCKPFYCRNR